MHFTLRRTLQRYLFMNSKHHENDAFPVTIQLLVVTIRKINPRTEAMCTQAVSTPLKLHTIYMRTPQAVTSSYHHKQWNGLLEGITFVMVAVHEQVALALMSSS